MAESRIRRHGKRFRLCRDPLPSENENDFGTALTDREGTRRDAEDPYVRAEDPSGSCMHWDENPSIHQNLVFLYHRKTIFESVFSTN